MKNSEQKKLDQLLKDQLSEGTANVPDFVWDRIEEELFPKKRKRRFFWWFFGGFSVLIISVLLSLTFSSKTALSQRTSLAQEHASSTPGLNAEISVQNSEDIIRKSSKTKGCSQYREHATDLTKFSRSRVNLYHLKTEQKTPAPALNSFKSKSELRISSGQTTADLSLPLKEEQTLQKGIQNLPIEDSNRSIQSVSDFQKEELKTDKENNRETKRDTLSAKDPDYRGILALVKRDFCSNQEAADEKRHSIFSIGIYGGTSLYNTAVFKDYFTSGQLSNRSFASSGFELGFHLNFKLGKRFQIYTGIAFNQKQTQFNYNVAITEADYFTYLANGEKVPLANIRDDGANSCFLAKDVTVRYQIQSTLISLGTSFEFLKIGKLSAAANVRLSCNLQSSLHLKETQVLSIQQPDSERFSYFQPGAGLIVSYQLNDRISLGLSPLFSKQFYTKRSFLHKMDELVIPVTFSFRL